MTDAPGQPPAHAKDDNALRAALRQQAARAPDLDWARLRARHRHDVRRRRARRLAVAAVAMVSIGVALAAAVPGAGRAIVQQAPTTAAASPPPRRAGAARPVSRRRSRRCRWCPTARRPAVAVLSLDPRRQSVAVQGSGWSLQVGVGDNADSPPATGSSARTVPRGAATSLSRGSGSRTGAPRSPRCGVSAARGRNASPPPPPPAGACWWSRGRCLVSTIEAVPGRDAEVSFSDANGDSSS